MSTPSAALPTWAPGAAPGWYRDGVTPSVIRWFDGARWTEHTAPDPAFADSIAVPARLVIPGEDTGPGSAIHWMVPVGRSWQSILAGYLGIFSLLIWPLGVVSIGVGVWALVRARHGGHGRGRAITGIVGGLIGLVILMLLVNGGFFA